jgi:hypothetical protein
MGFRKGPHGSTGANWTGGLLAKHSVQPGNCLRVDPTGTVAQGLFPHSTEDVVVHAGTIAAIAGPKPVWSGSGAPPAAGTVMTAFDKHVLENSQWGGVKKGGHVVEGTRTKSLVALTSTRSQLKFFEHVYNDKKSLRVILDDGEARYNFKGVSAALQQLYRNGGVEEVEKAIPARGNLHVRLGLARAWPGQPGKCYIMLNGVLW